MVRTPRPFFALAAIAALAGCAGETGDAVAASVDYDPAAVLRGDLTIMGFEAEDEVAAARIVLTEKALGEDVTVKLLEGDLDLQRFLSSVASGNPPELLYADRDQIGSLVARGAIIPLDDCIGGEGIDTSQFVPSAIDQVTLEGSVYGIPEFNSVQLVMANQSLLRSVGLTLDDVNGSDWDATRAANKALYSANDGKLSVIGFDSRLPESLPLWAKANGADLISADGRTAQLNMPAVVDALEWAVSIYDDQGGFDAVKAFRGSADFFGNDNQFAANTLGAMPMEHWYLTVLNDVSPSATLGFDTVRDREGDPIAHSSGSAWAIPAGSDNPQAACRWAATMTSVDAWLAAAEARRDTREGEGKHFTGILTGNTVADERIREMVTLDGEPWHSGFEAMYLANEHSFSLAANPAGAAFENAMLEAVNSALSGQSSAQDALDGAQAAAQRALDNAWDELSNSD